MANQFIFPDFKQIFDIFVIQVLGEAKGSAMLIWHKTVKKDFTFMKYFIKKWYILRIILEFWMPSSNSLESSWPAVSIIPFNDLDAVN